MARLSLCLFARLARPVPGRSIVWRALTLGALLHYSLVTGLAAAQQGTPIQPVPQRPAVEPTRGTAGVPEPAPAPPSTAPSNTPDSVPAPASALPPAAPLPLEDARSAPRPGATEASQAEPVPADHPRDEPPPPAMDSARPSEPSASEAPAVPAHDWRAVAYGGAFSGAESISGLAVGGTLQYRVGPIVGGALVEYGLGSAGLLGRGYEYTGVAALGGLGLRPAPNLRLDLLGVIGRHGYDGVGLGGWSGDPGTDGATAYGGVRAALSYLFGAGPGHFELGTYADFQDDLSRQRVHYTYWEPDSCGFGGCQPGHSVSAEQVIGTARFGIGVQLGLTYDVL